MQTKRMTITEGLVELKLYDSKINKAIVEANFISAKKKKDKRIGRLSQEEFEKRASESYQSIIQMMANRNAIKRAIVLSNATTMVEIAGDKMTVAEAIEKRNLNISMNNLLKKMYGQLLDIDAIISTENRKLDDQIEKLLVSYYGKDAAKKVSKEDYDNIANPYREANEYIVVDPLNLQKIYDELNQKNEAFMSSVDTALSVSNATTFIEVEV